MRYFLIVFLFYGYNALFLQTAVKAESYFGPFELFKTIPKDSTLNTIEINSMPLALVDWIPRMRMGIEYWIDEHNALCFDFGFGNYSLSRFSIQKLWTEDYHANEFRFEYKFYAKKHKTFYHPHSYYSVEIFYITMGNTFTGNHYYDKKGGIRNVIVFDKAKYVRKKYGVHIKYGEKIFIYKKINVDLYCGIGLARRLRAYSELENYHISDSPIEDFFYVSYRYPGDKFVVNVTAGIKVAIGF